VNTLEELDLVELRKDRMYSEHWICDNSACLPSTYCLLDKGANLYNKTEMITSFQYSHKNTCDYAQIVG